MLIDCSMQWMVVAAMLIVGGGVDTKEDERIWSF
jgi:hypothetical protein